MIFSLNNRSFTFWSFLGALTVLCVLLTACSPKAEPARQANNAEAAPTTPNSSNLLPENAEGNAAGNKRENAAAQPTSASVDSSQPGAQPALVDVSDTHGTQKRDFGKFTRNQSPKPSEPSAKPAASAKKTAEEQAIEKVIDEELAPEITTNAKPLFEGAQAQRAEEQLQEIEQFDPEDYREPELTPEQQQKMQQLQQEANQSRTNSDSFLKIANESQRNEEENAEPPIPEEDLPEGALDPKSPNYDWKAALNAKPKPLDLGEPLVEKPDQLTRLHPSQNIWFDKTQKEVVLLGAVAQPRGSLELFACTGRIAKDIFGNIMPNGPKTHESVVVIDITPHLLHAALLAAEAEPGRPAVFSPKFEPPTGEEIAVLVRWKAKDGTIQEKQAGEWIVDEKTGKHFDEPFVFTGSMFMVNAENGKRRYMADTDGELICVSNFPSAVMDIPIESSSSDLDRLYMANEKAVPERGTPVTLILRPIKKTTAKPEVK